MSNIHLCFKPIIIFSPQGLLYMEHRGFSTSFFVIVHTIFSISMEEITLFSQPIFHDTYTTQRDNILTWVSVECEKYQTGWVKVLRSSLRSASWLKKVLQIRRQNILISVSCFVRYSLKQRKIKIALECNSQTSIEKLTWSCQFFFTIRCLRHIFWWANPIHLKMKAFRGDSANIDFWHSPAMELLAITSRLCIHIWHSQQKWNWFWLKGNSMLNDIWGLTDSLDKSKEFSVCQRQKDDLSQGRAPGIITPSSLGLKMKLLT